LIEKKILTFLKLIFALSKSANMANKKSQERELAAQLYINTNLSQKEIAQRIGVTEKSISSWVNEGNWEYLKTSKQSTNAETIATLKKIMKIQADENLKKLEEKTFTKNDADSLIEIAKSIDILQGKGISLRDYIEIMEEFIDFVPADNAKAQKIKSEIADLQVKFLLNKAQG
jgi:transposase